jgi:pilus assembly protein CpaE
MDKIRILVADDTEETRQLVSRFLEFNEGFELVGTAENGQEAIDKIASLQPDVILMDINMPVMNGLEATEFISTKYPQVVVIIMSVQSEVEYMKKAMVSGAKEYIIKPFTIDDLTQTIETTFEKVKERLPVETQAVKVNVNQSEVIAMFSSKGGVGKTVIATNLAYGLSQLKKGRVVLVDFDLQFGDVGMVMNLKPKVTLTELIDEQMTADEEGITNYMIEVKENFDVLLAPRKPEYAEYVAEKHIKDIIKTLRKRYEYIIIDTATNFEDTTLAVLDCADKVYYIATMDLLAIKNTKLGLDVMNSLRYSQDKVRVLINRNVKSAIHLTDVEKILNYKIETLLVEDSKTLLRSVNQGVPVLADSRLRSSKFAKGIIKMAKQLIKEA